MGVNRFSISLRFQEFGSKPEENRFGETNGRSAFIFDRMRTAASTRFESYYNDGVARGWESKSVEGQQADANEKPAPGRPRLSAEEAAHWRERENLRLSRQRVLQQLEASRNPRHRKLLEEALADLDEKLKQAEG